MNRQKYTVEVLVDDIGLTTEQARKLMAYMSQIADEKLDEAISFVEKECSAADFYVFHITQKLKSLKSKQNERSTQQ